MYWLDIRSVAYAIVAVGCLMLAAVAFFRDTGMLHFGCALAFFLSAR